MLAVASLFKGCYNELKLLNRHRCDIFKKMKYTNLPKTTPGKWPIGLYVLIFCLGEFLSPH